MISSYEKVKGLWFKIIDMNVHASSEDKSDSADDSFCGELGRILDQFPRCGRKILLGEFNVKVRKEDIFKPTTGNEISHEISNVNEVSIVTLPSYKKSLIKAQCSLIASFINTPGTLLREKSKTRPISS